MKRATINFLVLLFLGFLLVAANPAEQALAADTWYPMNSSGFGGNNNLAASKLAAINDRLFAGTINNSGSEIRITNTLDFTNNSQQPVSNQHRETTSFASFPYFENQYVYAGLNDDGPSNARVVYYDPQVSAWSNANLPNAGGGNGSNVGATDLFVYKNYLYVGTNNPTGGAQIWRLPTNTFPLQNNWQLVMTGGNGNNKYFAVQRFFVVNDQLFVSYRSSASGSSCRLSRTTTGDNGAWENVVANGLPTNTTSCISSSAKLFTLTWVGLDTSVGAGLYYTLDGVNYSGVGLKCIVTPDGQTCNSAGSDFNSRITSLSTIPDKQLLIGTTIGEVWRVCPSHFYGSFTAFFKSFLEDDYRIHDVGTYKNNIVTAGGQRDGNGSKAMVWRTPFSNLIRFPQDKCGPVVEPSKAALEINLPPKLIFTPSEFLFNTDKYVFRDNPPRLDPNGTINGTQEVSVEKIDQDGSTGGDSRGEYYKIKVAKIEKNRIGQNPLKRSASLFAKLSPLVESAKAYAPPPALNPFIFRRATPFRLTFAQPVPADNFNSLAAYLSEKGNKDNAFFGSNTCQNNGQRSFICFKETVKVTNPDTSEINLTLNQKIELSGVYVQGNVAATQQIANIRLSPNAIAVGGTFNDVTGTTLDRYLQNTPSAQIKWDGVGGAASKIQELFDKRTKGTSISRSVIDGVWYLNTSSNNPADFQTPNSFTAPPEGRLWNVNPANSTFTFNNVDFRGHGTVVINGNAIFNGSVKCSDSKRVGILVRGNIVFNATHIECGAYVALGSGAAGFIDFRSEPPNEGETAKGIFIAKDNITIPQAASSPFLIDYDASFAQQPTILFKELLNILLIALS